MVYSCIDCQHFQIIDDSCHYMTMGFCTVAVGSGISKERTFLSEEDIFYSEIGCTHFKKDIPLFIRDLEEKLQNAKSL